MQEMPPQSDIDSRLHNVKLENTSDEKSNPVKDKDQQRGNNNRKWHSKGKYDHRQKDGRKRDNNSRDRTGQHRPQNKNRGNDQKHENKSDDKDQRTKDNKVNSVQEPKIESVNPALSKTDPKIECIKDDPRPPQRITKEAKNRGKGRNTESFDPESTLVRPDLRIQIGSNSIDIFNKPLKHDDVVIIPELFGKEDDWSIYYKLVEEMRELQSQHKDAEWISWHEGAHLISNNPKGCPTYEKIVSRLCQYFKINQKKSIGTRFNWYRDSLDWKPFHHDSAAYNPSRAKNQNITIGASFGATRELAFLRASSEETNCKLYFPQVNNGVFSFGRDANILWKHGINALKEEEQDGKGRISIILWGYAEDVIEEEGSPPMLGADGKGPHANTGHRKRYNGRRNDRHDNRPNGKP